MCIHCYKIYLNVIDKVFRYFDFTIAFSCTGSRHSFHYAADTKTVSGKHFQKHNGACIVCPYQLSANRQREISAHHSGPPLNQVHIGQFGTVSYHHGHSQIAGIHHVISKFMPGQTVRPLYGTSRWCSRYLEQSFGRLLEMFVPVNSIRDRHMQTPGLPYLR